MLQKIWLLLVVLTAVPLLLWAMQGAGVGVERVVRISGVLFIAVPCMWCGWLAASRHPVGMLQWDGVAWHVDGGVQNFACSGQVYVLLDLQRWMVVCCTDEQQARHRLLLQKNSAPALWMDLRRAVYSSAELPQSTTQPQ